MKPFAELPGMVEWRRLPGDRVRHALKATNEGGYFRRPEGSLDEAPWRCSVKEERKAELLAQGVIKTGNELGPPKPKRCSSCSDSLKGKEADEAGRCERCAFALLEEKSQAELRRAVYARDRGVCAECGMDCEEMWSTLRAALDIASQKQNLSNLAASRGQSNWARLHAAEAQAARNTYEARVHQLVRLGFPRSDVEQGRTLWDCDHRVPKVKGGASTLAQARTLCLACHSKATSGLANDRAKARGSQWKKGRKLRG